MGAALLVVTRKKSLVLLQGMIILQSMIHHQEGGEYKRRRHIRAAEEGYILTATKRDPSVFIRRAGSIPGGYAGEYLLERFPDQYDPSYHDDPSYPPPPWYPDSSPPLPFSR